MSLTKHDLANATHTRAAMPLCERLAAQCIGNPLGDADAAALLSPLLIREQIPNHVTFADRIDTHTLVTAS